MYRKTLLVDLKNAYAAYKRSRHLSYEDVSERSGKLYLQDFLIKYLDSRFRYLAGGPLSYTSLHKDALKRLNKDSLDEHMLCLKIARTLAKRLGGSVINYLMPSVKGICLPEGYHDENVNLSHPVWILSDDKSLLIHSRCIVAAREFTSPEISIIVHWADGQVQPGYQLTEDELRRLIDHNATNKALYKKAKILNKMNQFALRHNNTLPEVSLRSYVTRYLHALEARAYRKRIVFDEELIELRNKIMTFLMAYNNEGLGELSGQLQRLFQDQNHGVGSQIKVSIARLQTILADIDARYPKATYTAYRFHELIKKVDELESEARRGQKGQDPVGISYLEVLQYIETSRDEHEGITPFFKAAVRRSDIAEISLFYKLRAGGLARFCFEDACRAALDNHQAPWFEQLLFAREVKDWGLILQLVGQKCGEGKPEYLQALIRATSPTEIVYQLIKHKQPTKIILNYLLANHQLDFSKKMDSRTLLQWAAFYRRWEHLKILFDVILTQRIPNSDDDSLGLGDALARSCYKGGTTCLTKGLQIGGFNPNARSTNTTQTRTIAESLVFYKHHQCLEQLVKNGLNPFYASSGSSLIDYIIERNDDEALNVIVKARAEYSLVNDDFYEGIALRLLDGNLPKLVQVLLNNRCISVESVLRHHINPTVDAGCLIIDPNPYLHAALVNNPDSAWSQFLFTHPAIDLFAKMADKTVFHILVMKEAWTKVRDLLIESKSVGKTGSNLEEVVCYVLIHAALSSQSQIVNLCMEFKFNPNKFYVEGLSVLHYAIKAGDVPLIEGLLARGADPLGGKPSAKEYAASLGNQHALGLIDKRLAQRSLSLNGIFSFENSEIRSPILSAPIELS